MSGDWEHSIQILETFGVKEAFVFSRNPLFFYVGFYLNETSCLSTGLNGHGGYHTTNACDPFKFHGRYSALPIKSFSNPH